jgi:hypothetical protein
MSNSVQCVLTYLAQIIISTQEAMMHTKDRLAGALREAGLPLMARMAEAGVYSNGLSLHAMPEMVLRRDLEDARSTLASALLWRVDEGEFEATDEELDAGNEQMVTGGMILALAQKFNTPRAWSPPVPQRGGFSDEGGGCSPQIIHIRRLSPTFCEAHDSSKGRCSAEGRHNTR